MNRVYDICRRRDRGGVNRTVAILLVLVAVMLCVVAVPAWKMFRYRSEKTACVQAMKSATDGLIIEYLHRMDDSSVEEAMETLDRVMVARPNICPAGGEVYIVMADNGVYKTLCGLHDDDKQQRVRLNASRAKDLLTEKLRTERNALEEEPQDIEIPLNGKQLKCVRVRQEEALHRGTATTKGYEGVVAYYGVEGDGFNTDKVAEGEICYFLYADEYYCAIWRADDGWTGDSYKVDN